MDLIETSEKDIQELQQKHTELKDDYIKAVKQSVVSKIDPNKEKNEFEGEVKSPSQILKDLGLEGVVKVNETIS